MQNIIEKLFSKENTIAFSIFDGKNYPHQALPEIKGFIFKLGQTLNKELYNNPSEGVWIAKTAIIAPSAFIGSPCIIDDNAEIRHCAYIRGPAIVGKNTVVGNSTELKNVILFDNVQVPHYNYVGDSILGFKSHMGAGSITSNVKMDKTLIGIDYGNGRITSGYKKLGAILGDFVEVGCGSVLNPGTVVGKNTNIYPLSSVRGYIQENSLYKKADVITQKNLGGK